MKSTLFILFVVVTLFLNLLLPIAHANFENGEDDAENLDEFEFYKRDPLPRRSRAQKLVKFQGVPPMKRAFEQFKRDNPVRTETVLYLLTLAKFCAKHGNVCHRKAV
ncbi:uncharacterized protein LOC144434453 isoform X1 [Glandiceps talaboti]